MRASRKKNHGTEKTSKPTVTISLTKEEALELENVQLKIHAAMQELQALQVRKAELEAALEKRHGVSIRGWHVDLEKRMAVHPDVAESLAKQRLPQNMPQE